MHFHRGQFFQDIRHPGQFRPVELDVLTGGEMTVAFVVAAGDVCELAQLAAAQMAVGNGDAQHRRMSLHIEAVHQPQRAKLVLAQFAGQVAPGLITELGHALAHDAVVDFIILIHGLFQTALCRAFQGLAWCRPHSLDSGFSHHQRPARTSSPTEIARVQGAQPMEG